MDQPNYSYTEVPGGYEDRAGETRGELAPRLDQAPAGWLVHHWRNLYGLRCRDGRSSLIVKPAEARAGQRVVASHRLPAGESGCLQIGDGTKIAVGNGRTEFIARPGLTWIRLTRGGSETCCEVTLTAFAAPDLVHLRWLGQPVVSQPATLEWGVADAAKTRLEIEQSGRRLFDSASPDRSPTDAPPGAYGQRDVRFERTGDVVVRLTAQSPAAPWRDLRERVFTVTTPVAPALPTVDEITVPPHVRVGDDIPIRWRLSGADRLRLRCAQAGGVWEQTLPPNGETVLFAISVGHPDLCFLVEPVPPAEDEDASSPGAAAKTMHRRITIRPRIEISAREIRGRPLSQRAVNFAIHGASRAWLVHPLRQQSDEIPLSGVMRVRFGDWVELVTIMARADTGEESAEVITLIPVEGFFRRWINARSWK